MKFEKQKKKYIIGQTIRIKSADSIIPHLIKSKVYNDYRTKKGVWVPEIMVSTFGEYGYINDIYPKRDELSIKIDNRLWRFESWMID